MLTRRIIFALAMLLPVGPALSVDADAKDYFEGKAITLIVPVPGGSGLDRLARSFAHHWKKHIPGNPQIVVKNIPGAGGAKALNHLYERTKPDGLSLAWGPWNAAGIISGLKGLRFVPEKFELIGTGGIGRVTLIRTDTPPGIKNPADVVKLKSFNVGGRRADRALDMIGNLSLELIGAKYRFIGGYRGMAKINPAFRRNEVQAAHSGSIGYYVFFKQALLDTGKAIALWYHPSFTEDGTPIPSKGFPGEKSFVDVYKEVHGKMPSGPLWETYKWYIRVIGATSMTVFATPGSPKQAVEILRKAHYANTKDPAYTEPEKKRLGGVGIDFLPLEEGLRIMKTYRDVGPEMKAVLKRMSAIGRK